MSAEPFGPGSAWLAVRTNDREALRAALGFERLEEAPFAEGLSRVGRGRAFVTPPIDGWTLVVLDRPDASELRALAERISKSIGEAQAFVCRDKRRHYAWLCAKDGNVERAFEELGGEIVRDEGDRLRGEPHDPARLEERHVLEVAGSWSVDPSTLALKSGIGPGFVAVWPEDANRARWDDVLGGVVGTIAVVFIEIAAVLALGRAFARTSEWWIGVALGLVLLGYAQLAPDSAKLKRPALLVGVALALGAVLGGAFPATAH